MKVVVKTDLSSEEKQAIADVLNFDLMCAYDNVKPDEIVKVETISFMYRFYINRHGYTAYHELDRITYRKYQEEIRSKRETEQREMEEREKEAFEQEPTKDELHTLLELYLETQGKCFPIGRVCGYKVKEQTVEIRYLRPFQRYLNSVDIPFLFYTQNIRKAKQLLEARLEQAEIYHQKLNDEIDRILGISA